jgi:hypothetical protein
MTAPTYAAALAVPTIPEVEADLLSRLPASLLAGWSADAPQRQLLSAEAQALQFQEVQRAASAYAASPAQVRQLRAFLVAQGYSATDAADIAAAWVDLVLEVYQSPRIPASRASWLIPLAAPSSQVIGPSSTIVLQADDGTLYQSAQLSALALVSSGGLYRGAVVFNARAAGSGGNAITQGTTLHVVQGPAGLVVDTSSGHFPTLLVPGRDTEADEDALARAVGRWGTLGGVLTRDGWRFVMQTPEVGGVATLTRIWVDDTNPLGPGSVRILVGNDVGAPTAAELAQAQGQGARFRPAGQGVVGVEAALVTTVAISATLATDGTNPLAAAQAASALVQLGGRVVDVLYLDAVIGTLMGIAGVVNVPALSLSADVVRPPGTVLAISPTVTAL